MARQDQKYRVVNYGIQNAEKQLWGQLYLPEVDEESEKIPLVIFCHGLGGSSDDMVPYASLLAQRGYAGYVFDFTGGSPSSRSGGNFHDMGLSTEINDLKAVYTNLCALPRFSKIYLAGHSQGSVVAAMAARDLRPIDGLILLSPAFVMNEAFRERFPEVEDIPAEMTLFQLRVGRRYITEAWMAEFDPVYQAYDGPVLIIHGSDDTVVPLSYAINAAKAYADALLVILPNVRHTFKRKEILTCVNLIDGFLTNHF